jgi:hypothetical protein
MTSTYKIPDYLFLDEDWENYEEKNPMARPTLFIEALNTFLQYRGHKIVAQFATREKITLDGRLTERAKADITAFTAGARVFSGLC